MKQEKQFDGVTKTEAFTDVLKTVPAMLIENFEFDDDTQIATWDERGFPVISRDPDPESEENKLLNLAVEGARAERKDLAEKIKALDTRERELQERGFQLNALEKAIDEKQAQLDESIKELEKRKLGLWGRTKSYFHGIN